MLNIIVANSKGSEILNKQCREIQLPLEYATAETIINALKEVLDSNPDAVGIAAPQIGINRRIALIHKSVVGKNEHLVLINPDVKAVDKDMITETEGCLSFPGLSKKIRRNKNITVSAHVNMTEGKVTFKLADIAARVVQHEVDHLNGVTILNK